MNRFFYLYRRYLCWIPVQFCFCCSRPYWGGWPMLKWSTVLVSPKPNLRFKGKLVCVWDASMKEYCSKACLEVEYTIINEMMGQ